MNNLTSGFASPIEAQGCFRGIVEAFSHPGAVQTLAAAPSPPSSLSPASAAILLTLADPTVCVSLEGPARDWLVFHTGARIAPAEAADFVATAARPRLEAMCQGTDDEPENSTTLILDCASLSGGRLFRLAGPGIERAIILRLPLDADFAAEWQAQSRRAPRGVDILLCEGNEIIGLPRSLTIEVM